MSGLVSLVGAGPGHPDYLTLKGARLLAHADVIVRDGLISNDFARLFAPDAEIRYVGKRCGRHSANQDEIIALLIDRARQGKRVVRLKGGDPGLFSRGGEEIEALRAAAVPFEIVPGVSSLFAGAAAAGFSLTRRGVANRVLVVDGHDVRQGDFDFHALVARDTTTAVLMGSRHLERLAAGMIAAGGRPNLPMTLVESATFSEQRVSVSTLALAAEGAVRPAGDGPGIIYVGPVTSLP